MIFLSLRAADLSRRAMTIQTNLDSIEDTIQSINHTLAAFGFTGSARLPDNRTGGLRQTGRCIER